MKGFLNLRPSYNGFPNFCHFKNTGIIKVKFLLKNYWNISTCSRDIKYPYVTFPWRTHDRLMHFHIISRYHGTVFFRSFNLPALSFFHSSALFQFFAFSIPRRGTFYGRAKDQLFRYGLKSKQFISEHQECISKEIRPIYQSVCEISNSRRTQQDTNIDIFRKS